MTSTDSDTSSTVVLVPGLGLGGAEMMLLSRRLCRRGYGVVLFRHCPWRGTLESKASDLAATVAAIDSPTVHFLGHSMGGLIILELFRRHRVLPPGRIVLVGSPINGSLAGRRVTRLPLGKLLVGRCMSQACRQRLPLPADRAVAGICGRINWGLGWLLWLPRPNDSVVAVEEAQRPEMQDRCVLSQTHVSLLFSTQVVDKVDGFLKGAV